MSIPPLLVEATLKHERRQVNRHGVAICKSLFTRSDIFTKAKVFALR
ncbi:MAG: hypothetical protein IKN27_05695 [Selenomonadaceae bacterium]|nr:hypothetical protein [Selenomonadaceae bacterium]